MADPRVVALLRRREILEAGLEILLPRLRVFFVVGGILVLMASAGMSSVVLMRSTSLAPIGIFMVVAGLLESGIGHIARGGSPNSNPWQTAGVLHMVAGIVTIFLPPVVPGWVLVTLVGASVLGAGVTWLRMGFAMPERFQTGVIPLTAGISCVIALLFIFRWGANDPLLMGLMLSGEMLLRGWAWIVLGIILGKR
jgi:uncharacterized membrane protein HdeD (DUF308 family)